MFTCNGTRRGLAVPHQHTTALDAKLCYGIIAAPEPPAPAQINPATFRFGHRSRPRGPLSRAQYEIICREGGPKDPQYALTLTYEDASRHITRLRGGVPNVAQTPAPAPQRDPRFDMVEALLDMVPDGYYAVGTDPERMESLTFIRLSKPTKNKFAGAWKFQQVIGSGLGYRLEDYATRWPSGRWIFYDRFNPNKADEVLKNIMLICADHQSAAVLYAQHIGRCARCNATLTDERSRFYGIGPECEKYWPDYMALVEDKKGVYR